MKIVTVELKNDSDVELLVALTHRLDGEILNVQQVNDITGRGPVYWLKEIAKRGGVKTITDPSDWQKDQRQDKTLINR